MRSWCPGKIEKEEKDNYFNQKEQHVWKSKDVVKKKFKANVV